MEPVYRYQYDMFVRPGTSDDFICDESHLYEYLFLNNKAGDTFMDIGANIGSTTKLSQALPNVNVNTIAYEPDKENYKLLEKNTWPYIDVTTINVAVGNENKDNVPFFIDNGSFKAKHSTVEREFKHGFTKTLVNQVSFREQLDLHKPKFLKIDIEGGEFNLDFNNLPKYIKSLAIEIHLINNNHIAMLSLYNKIRDQFYFEIGNSLPLDIESFKQTFNEENDCFLVIFHRN